jgi:hypothetical protein
MNAQLAAQIGNDAISEFLVDWKENPWAWMQEVDVQVDLIARIKKKFAVEDKYVFARHGYYPDLQRKFSRVTCEPYVLIERSRSAIHPDIVIWGDEKDVRKRTEYINSGYWPILWACEIKYSFVDPARGEEEDRSRLEQLIANSGTVTATQLVLVQRERGEAQALSQTANTSLVIRREYIA